MRWQHCIDHADKIIHKPAESPDCLHGVVTLLTDSQLPRFREMAALFTLVDLCSADVASRGDLLQNRVETLIDSQAEFKIN